MYGGGGDGFLDSSIVNSSRECKLAGRPSMFYSISIENTRISFNLGSFVLLLLLLLSLLLLLLSIDIGEIVSQRFETFLPYIHNSLRATTFPSPVSLTIRCDRIFEI